MPAGQADPPADAGAAFVEGFARAWDRPTPERLLELLHPEVRLVGPLVPVTVGHAQAGDMFATLLRAMHGLRGEVHRWAPHRDGVFIDFTLSALPGRRPLRWRAINRFVLDGGLALERVNYFNPLPVLRSMAWHPLRGLASTARGIRPRRIPAPDAGGGPAPSPSSAEPAERLAAELSGPGGQEATPFRWGAGGGALFVETLQGGARDRARGWGAVAVTEVEGGVPGERRWYYDPLGSR